jgi:AbrB family looped-hinge helix DNA binding protein
MNSVKARVDSQGRLVIPAAIRKSMGIREGGDEVSLRFEDGELRVWTIDAGIRRAQAIVAKYVEPGRSLADELIAERRREAANE